MELLSEKYGWTPTQIRAEKWEDINSYLDIIAIRNKLEKARKK
jgi:hypothetical protein